MPPAEPKSTSIMESLRAQIADGTLPEGEFLPGEHQLAELHGVSRWTVRDAISRLVGEGLVATEAKRGTFVRRRRERARYTDTRTLSHHKGQFHDADTDTWRPTEQSTSRINANDDLALAFGVQEHTPVIVFDRLLTNSDSGRRLVNRLYVPISTAAQLPTLDEELGPAGDLYALLIATGMELEWTETVRAVSPSADDIARLQLASGAPVLITRRTTSSQGRPIALDETRRAAIDVQLAYTITPTGQR